MKYPVEIKINGELFYKVWLKPNFIKRLKNYFEELLKEVEE